MKIQVKKVFPYRGEQHKVGKIIDVPAKFGNLMCVIGKAEEYIEPTPPPKPEPTPPPKKEPVQRRSQTATHNRAMSAAKSEEKEPEKTENTYETKAEDDK